MRKVSEACKAVVAIVAERNAAGCNASLRTIAKAMGYRSQSSVLRLVRRLLETGELCRSSDNSLRVRTESKSLSEAEELLRGWLEASAGNEDFIGLRLKTSVFLDPSWKL